MMRSSDWTKRLKYLVTNRKTYYDNSFPGNCGEINADGSISFDCIGMVKSVINYPDIVYKTSPAGFYVTPGQVIPDTTEMGILDLCSGVVWGDFSTCADGEYLYMDGHAGVYFSGNPDVNVVECTAAWSGGVVASWVDRDGTRRSHKGGGVCGRWEAHGKLSRYIDYSAKPAPEPPKPAEKLASALAYDCVLQEWLPIVTSGPYAVDTIGNPGHAMGGFAVHCSDQDLKYAAKNAVGGWLPAVTGYNVSDYENGFAGDYIPIDCAIIFGKGIAYQAKLLDSQIWLPPVYSDHANYNDAENGYAGIPGKAIDEMRIWRV